MRDVTIAIPTYNRASLTHRAVIAAMSQTYENLHVIVIDDGSTDNTLEVLSEFFDQPNFLYVKLGRNVGTANAKNVALMLCQTKAISFHDPDDIPLQDKIICQARTLFGTYAIASSVLNWQRTSLRADQKFYPDVVLSGHDIVLPSGKVVRVSNDLSLVDDFFPQLSIGSETPGDWVHINSGLFRLEVFEKIGGFDDCIEEDRDLRNRIIMAGLPVRVIKPALLVKYECEDSLTQASETNYASERRQKDREKIWQRISSWSQGVKVDPIQIALDDITISFMSKPWSGNISDVPMVSQTQTNLNSQLAQWQKRV